MNAFDIGEWKGKRVRHRTYNIEGTVLGPWNKNVLPIGPYLAEVNWDNGSHSVDAICDLEEIDQTSKLLWDDMRVWYPPGDPKGKWYRTRYVEKTNAGATVLVVVQLIPEDERDGKKG